MPSSRRRDERRGQNGARVSAPTIHNNSFFVKIRIRSLVRRDTSFNPNPVKYTRKITWMKEHFSKTFRYLRRVSITDRKEIEFNDGKYFNDSPKKEERN